MAYTKKQLEEEFKLSKSAVHNRLHDCGLDTTKATYSDEEIEANFKVACSMMQAGESRKAVRDHFCVGDNSQANSTSEHESNSYGVQDILQVTEAMSSATKQHFESEINDAVEGLIPYVPVMISEAINKAISSGKLHEAMLKYEEQRRKARDAYYSSSTLEIHKPLGGLTAGSDEEDDEDFEIKIKRTD
jgi:hypothetical protein